MRTGPGLRALNIRNRRARRVLPWWVTLAPFQLVTMRTPPCAVAAWRPAFNSDAPIPLGAIDAYTTSKAPKWNPAGRRPGLGEALAAYWLGHAALVDVVGEWATANRGEALPTSFFPW